VASKGLQVSGVWRMPTVRQSLSCWQSAPQKLPTPSMTMQLERVGHELWSVGVQPIPVQ